MDFSFQHIFNKKRNKWTRFYLTSFLYQKLRDGHSHITGKNSKNLPIIHNSVHRISVYEETEKKESDKI